MNIQYEEVVCIRDDWNWNPDVHGDHPKLPIKGEICYPRDLVYGSEGKPGYKLVGYPDDHNFQTYMFAPVIRTKHMQFDHDTVQR